MNYYFFFSLETLSHQIVPHPNLSTINVSMGPNIIDKATLVDCDQDEYSYNLTQKHTVIQHHPDINRPRVVPVLPEKADLTVIPHDDVDTSQVVISHPPKIVDDPMLEEQTASFDTSESSSVNNSSSTTNSAKSFIINKSRVKRVQPFSDPTQLHKADVNSVTPLNCPKNVRQEDPAYSSLSYIEPDQYDLNSPQYVIEEFARKPIHSAVVYSYEHVDHNIPSVVERAELVELREDDDSLTMEVIDYDDQNWVMPKTYNLKMRISITNA